MFDIWRKINKKGAVAIPVNAAALAPLAWAEVGETYPELVPDECRQCNVFDSPQLIKTTPFVTAKGTESKHYLFSATDLVGGKSIKCSMHCEELVDTLGIKDYHADEFYDEEDLCGNLYGKGILTCGCGEPGCAGIWSQTFHVSDKMVHWSILHYEDELELFFERNAYENGLIKMLKDLVDHPGVYKMECGSKYEVNHSLFVEQVYNMLSRRKYFKDIWEAIAI